MAANKVSEQPIYIGNVYNHPDYHPGPIIRCEEEIKRRNEIIEDENKRIEAQNKKIEDEKPNVKPNVKTKKITRRRVYYYYYKGEYMGDNSHELAKKWGLHKTTLYSRFENPNLTDYVRIKITQ